MTHEINSSLSAVVCQIRSVRIVRSIFTRTSRMTGIDSIQLNSSAPFAPPFFLALLTPAFCTTEQSS